MTDSRKHRGPDPRDDDAFGAEALPALRQGVQDLSWLLSRGYAIVSAVKLVGDRWKLTERQRLAMRRAACSEEARAGRSVNRANASQVNGRKLLIDGFNVVTTVEAALGGGVVLRCCDETYRDVAGVHGTYRRVAETVPALRLVGQTVCGLNAAEVRWLFDRPVSNSRRIRGILLEIAEQNGWNWNADLLDNPDAELKASTDIVATTDSAILDRCSCWLNLAQLVIDAHCPAARIIDLAT
jgi:hypothetical protein